MLHSLDRNHVHLANALFDFCTHDRLNVLNKFWLETVQLRLLGQRRRRGINDKHTPICCFLRDLSRASTDPNVADGRPQSDLGVSIQARERPGNRSVPSEHKRHRFGGVD